MSTTIKFGDGGWSRWMNQDESLDMSFTTKRLPSIEDKKKTLIDHLMAPRPPLKDTKRLVSLKPKKPISKSFQTTPSNVPLVFQYVRGRKQVPSKRVGEASFDIYSNIVSP